MSAVARASSTCAANARARGLSEVSFCNASLSFRSCPETSGRQKERPNRQTGNRMGTPSGNQSGHTLNGWGDLGGRTAKGMVNQDTGRALSIGVRSLEIFRLRIGLNGKNRCQQDSKLGHRSHRQCRWTKRGDVDGYGLEIAGFMPFCILAMSASGAIGRCLRHMAVNHSNMVVSCREMEVKRRQTKEE